GVLVLDVGAAGRIMRQLVLGVLAQAQLLLADAVVRVPIETLFAPVLVPLVVLRRRDEELHLRLLELPSSEHEVAGRDLIAERLADLRDAEGRRLARALQDIAKVQEDALRGLGPQV